MTTFRLDNSPGPGTHVLLIGVGRYPYLKDGGTASPTGDRGLGQLTSPPVSAMGMLEWFDTKLHNPQAPLKSIEVLISQPGTPTYTDASGTTQNIDEANWDNFEKAALDWYNRHNSNPDNVAVFHFCGHGSGDGVQTYLLMSDTGKSPVFLRNALSFPAFRTAVGQSQARKQIFFVDACRIVDLAKLLDPNHITNSGLPVAVTRLNQGHSTALYSARIGEAAFGMPGQISEFTSALLQGLNRCGVFRVRGAAWAVQPRELQAAVAALMDDFSGKPQCDSDGISGNGFQLHVLQQPPEVVVHVSLNDPAANAAADISCKGGGKIVTRPNKEHPWRTFLPAGLCDVEATFAPPSNYQVASMQLHLFPPFQDIELEVT